MHVAKHADKTENNDINIEDSTADMRVLINRIRSAISIITKRKKKREKERTGKSERKYF